MYKVLLVDDEVFVRKGLMSLIDWEKYGFEIGWEAENGEDAFNIIQEEKPDLVITDVRMPVVDGLSLIKKVRELDNNETKFIIVSGYNDFSYAQQAVRYKVLDFVLKPIDQDELEETLEKLAKTLNQEKTETTEKQRGRIEQAFAQLIEGAFDESEVNDLAELLHITNEEYFYYALVEVNNIAEVTDVTDVSLDHLRVAIPEVIIKMSGSSQDTPLYEQSDFALGMVIPNGLLKKYNGDVTKFASQCKKNLSQTTNHAITICIGQKVNRLEDLKMSYETANHVRSYKYILTDEAPINYENIKDIDVNYNELDSKIYISLMEMIEENNVAGIKKIVEDIFLEFQTKRFAPRSVKTSINRCIHGMIQTINNMEGDEKNISTLQSMISWGERNLTLKELIETFTTFILECSAIIQNLRKDNMKGDIYKIKTYIENNYHQNISLKSIANKYYMNPVYMGQLFKKTFGVYFKEFLLKIRIDEAKKLLRQTDMRVYEVADKIGFGSTDYFVTQFEKINKMTPTEYRNQLLKNKD
ncbi:response regulator transcription factor [Anaerobacillus sp. CMMVII]|uniref:response regulator transcription factor n=1 Tax=Anaerobacillus sp. CMMVII TaxID=2755588 RepID=UPI0021B74573|nr:response regulator transcription factor [Anaerobacillus sp. CMMVII]MCT8137106.1 response regulator transcription factor [Anaerobacillus sp. CMMVII]